MCKVCYEIISKDYKGVLHSDKLRTYNSIKKCRCKCDSEWYVATTLESYNNDETGTYHKAGEAFKCKKCGHYVEYKEKQDIAKGIEKQQNRSGRVMLLVLSSLSVLIPIPAVIASLAVGSLLKKDVDEFTGLEFIGTCLFSFFLAIILDISLFIGLGLLFFIIYVILAIFLYFIKKEISAHKK